MLKYGTECSPRSVPYTDVVVAVVAVDRLAVGEVPAEGAPGRAGPQGDRVAVERAHDFRYAFSFSRAPASAAPMDKRRRPAGSYRRCARHGVSQTRWSGLGECGC